MKRNLLILALVTMAGGLSSCSSITGTSAHVVTIPETGAKMHTVNGVALQHYDPQYLTPYAYDHRGGAHDSYARAQAIRYGTVEVGRLERSGQ